MSFIGLVTRKEKDTGVNLMAKVVTESKKKSAKKMFKVKVKANALDDFTCCVIDHGTTVGKINQSQDMNNVTDDINMSYNGVNGTVISYRIIDIDIPLLSKYMADDGKVNGRPKFGEGSATGYIEITVSKNEASLTSRILTSVKSITAEEVLNDSTFTQMALWGIIRGADNDNYTQGNEWSGHNNIKGNLNLIKTQKVDTLSTTPVAITWVVKDNTVPYASVSNVYTDARIDQATGIVQRCPYKSACKLVNAISDISVKVISGNQIANSLQNRVRIGGITLTAKLTLGEATKDVVFNCSTISKYLTNEEIMAVVTANIALFRPDYVTIKYKESADSTYETITAPASGGKYVLRAFGNRGSETFSSPDLKLEEGSIIGVTITNNIYDFNGSSEYTDPGLLATAFDGGFQADDGETYMKLTIDFDVLKTATAEKRKFACNAKISISGYSSTGDKPGGASLMAQRFAQIMVDTASITTE